MHSFKYNTTSKAYDVVRWIDNRATLEIFMSLDLALAIKLVNCLNGGDFDLDEYDMKALEGCVVN